MSKRSPSGLILVGLALLLLAQGGLLALRTMRPAIAAQDRLEAGDVVGQLAATSVSGASVQLASISSEPTLLMVFNSKCAWTQEVAAVWRDWLADAPQDLRILAVSNEDAEVGRTYAAEVGWIVPTAAVRVRELGDDAHNLTSRTPWLFLVDEDGRILYEGHGERLDELDDVLGGRAGMGTLLAAGDEQ